ncbi:MAG: 4-alpha-glucanotransferase [Desulfuromonadaceae bacterium]|nr:4-alpha-glucanotransferase [Desulfuromonadaceae bacterium]MDD2848393.1 4-alpha-glucanotransferase [Desulfuromonadaceae bacterium]MDD4129211.1 4-alpha-glucanotransferase [Desulfuromonadaceae bacterium]
MSNLPDTSIREAMRLLGKTDFLLAVHDASFPGADGEDTGRGSPYNQGGHDLALFARSLGFTGLQLGPQGQTSSVNPSPYDGTLFSRNILSLDMKKLVDQGLLSRRTWETMLVDNPLHGGRRVSYLQAFVACNRALDEVYDAFITARKKGDSAALSLNMEIKSLWSSARWLRDDALYEVLILEHGDLPWRQWPQQGEAALDRVLCAPPAGMESACALRRHALEIKYARILERYSLAQQLLLRQHLAFRERMLAMGLKIYGDVQVGFSQSDAWSLQGLLLNNYFMGAPPSRTNVEGQPWSYQVLNPALYQDAEEKPGPVLDLVAERLGKMLYEFDGLRLDHPHGLVCPWVYRTDDPDPYHAVQNGARLFSSPDLADHPALAGHAIVRPEQLNRDRPRYADDWVHDLTPEQEKQYALILDALMEQVLANGRRKEDILCEVLSTEPLPLRVVRLRHGLGRFRVTQKADLDNSGDVYRSENAQPQDWVMVGNHDTPTIWRLAKKWQGDAEGMKQARYLARRLNPSAPDALAAALAADPRRLAHAKVADLFVSPARHVMLFFADLFGLEENYNVPGTSDQDNWTLRVPHDFSRRYEEGRKRGEVLNLHAVLALALRARSDIQCTELIARLEAKAGWAVNP